MFVFEEGIVRVWVSIGPCEGVAGVILFLSRVMACWDIDFI